MYLQHVNKYNTYSQIYAGAPISRIKPWSQPFPK